MGRRKAILPALCVAALMAAAPGLGAEGGERRGAAGTFRIGMVAPQPGSAAVIGAERIRAAFSGALAMPVELVVARDYAALVEAQAARHVHYAVYSATAYAAAWLRCECVQPVAAPVSADGSGAVESVLILAAGASAAPDDPAGGRVALGPAHSLTAGLLPLLLPQLAAVPQELRVAAASQAEAEGLLARGEVEAMFGWSPAGGGEEAGARGTLARLGAASSGQAGWQVAWRSAPVRHGPHAVRRDVGEEALLRLRAFLVGLHEADPGLYHLLERHHGGGFAPAAHEDYAPAIEALGRLTGGVSYALPDDG